MAYNSGGAYVSTADIGALGAAQAGVTGAGNTGAIEVGGRHTLRLTLNVTAASGTTPSLTVNVQTSPDGASWYTAGSFAAKTAVSAESKAFSGLDRFVRLQWGAPSGTTPNFSFNATGELV
ncbi:hypothetical protein [Streptomyces albidoflavus]|uniref:hypothetical protein n=1 Tax=Streptomyces albidoflavus TaxID=1886 RepID=UPI00331AC3F6